MEDYDFLDTFQAGERVGVSRSLIYHAIKNGALKHVVIAGRQLIRPADLDTWNAARLARGRGRYPKPAVMTPTPDRYSVPLAGAVGAGPGQDDPAEPGAMLHVHTLFTGDCVAYQVCGRSMESELIGDGDYVIVRRSPAPDSGERVVAWSRSSEGMVVRRLRVDGDGTRWYEAAPREGPRYRRPVQPDDVIYGVYCGIVRRVDPPATRSRRKRS